MIVPPDAFIVTGQNISGPRPQPSNIAYKEVIRRVEHDNRQVRPQIITAAAFKFAEKILRRKAVDLEFQAVVEKSPKRAAIIAGQSGALTIGPVVVRRHQIFMQMIDDIADRFLSAQGRRLARREDVGENNCPLPFRRVPFEATIPDERVENNRAGAVKPDRICHVEHIGGMPAAQAAHRHSA